MSAVCSQSVMRKRTVILLFSFILTTVKCTLRTDNDYWRSLTASELEDALRVQWNVGVAKNVILFIGDGMGPNTVTATRIYKGGESHKLVYETFPHMGLLKTYSADKMVPDSACSATALFTGVKTNQETMGVDATVAYQNCTASLQKEAQLDSLAAIALNAGKSAGLVTTTRVTHATPGPLYAHSASRKWECEDTMPPNSQCKDIARQLIEDWPGKDLHVVLGGGRQVLMSNVTGSQGDPIDTWACYSQDGRNLIQNYKDDKKARGLKYNVVYNTGELKSLDVENTDYLLGIFSNGHLKYEFERDKTPRGMPSISDMTEAAIKVLKKNTKGFFLMVEGGNIDMAHHRGRAKTAVDESAAMEDAVKIAISMTDETETLIIVTADHTHTMSINGYPYRGDDIFGVAPESPFDHTKYTILSYGTGGPGSFHYYVGKDSKDQSVVLRRDANLEDTKSFLYEQVAGIRLDENSHGGGDVTVYARGPFAHLFHNVHEQNYVFEVITYAAKIGRHSGTSPLATITSVLLIVVQVGLILIN